jgi:hypothetical protein
VGANKALCLAVIFAVGLAGCKSLPKAPTALVGIDDGIGVSLNWSYAGKAALGFILEQCSDTGECETAALVRADERNFVHYSMRPHHYRIAAFTKQGRSDWSEPTPMLGRDLKDELMPEPSSWMLDASESEAAKLINKAKLKTNADCTTPRKLRKQNLSLVCVHGLVDWYSDPTFCGSSGCIFYTASTVNGCYSIHAGDILMMAAPCHGKNLKGLVFSNVRNGVDTGELLIYSDAELIASYRYKNLDSADLSVPVEASIQSSGN